MGDIRTILGYIIAALFVVFVIVAFDELKKKNKKRATQQKYDEWMNDRQAYVHANLDKFGVNDAEGTSLDDREIYVVSPDILGTNPSSKNSIKTQMIEKIELPWQQQEYPELQRN